MLTLLFFITGLGIGSFLNVVIDRMPRREQLLTGRSHCDHCRKTLAWYDLIPLISFLSLKGKCRYCRKPIGWQAPLVEFLTGFLFVIAYYTIVNSTYLASLKHIIDIYFTLFIISSLIIVFFVDLKFGIIPFKVVLPACIITFAYLLFTSFSLLPNHLLSSLGAFVFFLVLFLVTKGRGMGFGDVVFSFFMGLLLGFPKIILALYCAFLTGAFFSLILVLQGKKKLHGTLSALSESLAFSRQAARV